MTMKSALITTFIITLSAVAAGAAERPGHDARAAIAPFDSTYIIQNGATEIGAARAAMLRECNAVSRTRPQVAWGVQEIGAYRACMARRHEAE